MNDRQGNSINGLPEPVYHFLTSHYLHQNDLMWSRTQLLVAIEGGTLAVAFTLKMIAVPVLLVGSVLVALIWLVVERDWEVRDQNLPLLDKVHKPLGIRMTKKPRMPWWSGTKILRVVFGGLLVLNLVMVGLIASGAALPESQEQVEAVSSGNR